MFKKYQMKDFLGGKTLFFTILLIGLFFIYSPESLAQCGPVTCTADIDCSTLGGTSPCPTCFRCVGGTCVADDPLCDDGNACTADFCEFDAIAGFIGCFNEPLALDPTLPDDLPIACYICEPTENGITVNNGVCDRGAGEDCTNSVDCQVPGETCIFPNSPTVAIGCTDQSSVAPLFVATCADGDACTEDGCVSDPSGPFCENPERTCGTTFDGCCPAGCVGPVDPVIGCPVLLATNCDVDCWPPQVCGDGFIQPPETCDDSADLGNAGVRPDGTVVSNADCRDPGATAECTYCGDNIIQTAAGEQCDGTDQGACESGCDDNCLCIVTDLQVQGSGPPWGPCSLNPHATNGPIKGMLGVLSLGLALGLLMAWRRRLN